MPCLVKGRSGGTVRSYGDLHASVYGLAGSYAPGAIIEALVEVRMLLHFELTVVACKPREAAAAWVALVGAFLEVIPAIGGRAVAALRIKLVRKLH